MAKHKTKQKIVTVEQLRKMENDCTAGLAEINGRSKRYVGIGWVDEGPATGKEPIKVVGVGGTTMVTGKSAAKYRNSK